MAKQRSAKEDREKSAAGAASVAPEDEGKPGHKGDLELLAFVGFLVLVGQCALGFGPNWAKTTRIAQSGAARAAGQPSTGATEESIPLKVTASSLVFDAGAVRVDGEVTNESSRGLLAAELRTKVTDEAGKYLGAISCELSALGSGKKAKYVAMGSLDTALRPGHTLEWKTTVASADWERLPTVSGAARQ